MQSPATTFNFTTLNRIANYIGKCNNQGLEPAGFTNIIRLRMSIDKRIAERNEVFIRVMREFGINNPERDTINDQPVMRWKYEDHPKAELIHGSVSDINNELRDVSPLRFMTEEDFFQFTKEQPISVDEATFLYPLLVKE